MTTHSNPDGGSMTEGVPSLANGVANRDRELNGSRQIVSGNLPGSQGSLLDSTEFLTEGPVASAIRKLSRAYEYSVDCDRSKWDFAVEIADLSSLGISHDELRWMIGKGLVEHARETGSGTGIGRSFDSPGGFTFSPRSCFVATATGLRLADHLMPDPEADPPGGSGFPQPAGGPRSSTIPAWDNQRHELRIGDVLVKRFKWRASNQEAILSAFQEDGWPARIDDPLPPLPETDPKRRLSDAIKCLNRKQQNCLLRFSGDGTGEGVLWDLAGDLASAP